MVASTSRACLGKCRFSLTNSSNGTFLVIIPFDGVEYRVSLSRIQSGVKFRGFRKANQRLSRVEIVLSPEHLPFRERFSLICQSNAITLAHLGFEPRNFIEIPYKLSVLIEEIGSGHPWVNFIFLEF